jgi:hypothetical protein
MTEPYVEFDPATEPLYRDVALRHVAEIPVLGIPIRFETNSGTVLRVVEESFGGWRSLAERADLLSSERVRVRLIVHEGDERTTGRAAFRYRVPDAERIVIVSPGSVAFAELARREGLAYVTPQLVADRAHFRYGLLEALTLGLVTHLDRTPVHAAAVVRNGVALLLAGATGTGKSTLAYAATLGGLRALSDDMVFVQLEPSLRIWGMPGRLHLLESAREHFAELADTPAAVLANGKEKVLVDVGGTPWVIEPPIAERAGICLLRRSGGPALLERMSSADLQATLLRGLERGFDRFRETMGPRLAALANGKGWRLNLSGHPADAVPYLHAMLDELEGRA